jgi:hypothetical protein
MVNLQFFITYFTKTVLKTTQDSALVLGLFWITVVGACYLLLENEEFTPIATGDVTAAFPLRSAIPRDTSRYTLVIFLHPLCPCSRATLNELSTLLPAIGPKTTVDLVFTIPEGVPENWEKGNLWNYASSLPGVNIFRDPGGREAIRFGVTGSGHALLFAASGQLRFSGGITISRGHDGENPGCTAILSLVETGRASINHTPVFGCSLL